MAVILIILVFVIFLIALIPMTNKAKLIRTVYLYLAALISLIFIAVGTGRLLNAGLKYYFFPKAEKGGYNRCNTQPPVYGIEKGVYANIATEDQKVQLSNMLADYEQWKQNNIGEECYSQERQNNIVDALTIMIIAIPICAIHWMVIRREKPEKEEEKEA